MLLLGAVAGCGGPPQQHDVFLLVVDTLRADHVGSYGYPRPTSPQLDRLAVSATVFTDVLAPAPWTLPSIGSLMTANFPSVHGLQARKRRGALDSLRPGLATLAETLKNEGYRTVALVTNPWVVIREHGLDRGFDEYSEVRGSARGPAENPRPRRLE